MEKWMISRRRFVLAAGAAALAASVPAWAAAARATGATALTEVFGDGVRLTAVAVSYDQDVSAAQISAKDFAVDGRTVTDVWVSRTPDLVGKAESGRFVIVKLSPDDAGLSLKEMVEMSNSTVKGGPKSGVKWVAGDKPQHNLRFKTATAQVRANGRTLTTGKVRNLVADDFKQLVYQDKKTGRSLRYNLFVPENHGRQPLPLVLFMHDAGVTGEFHTATLLQGLGAVVWAQPQEQAKRPCFVLAPQYDEIIVDDKSQASAMLDITVRLIEDLQRQYNIDKNRIYTTGQSGGCMMSIAMNIKYPQLFAAAYLVAGQWNADLVAPLAGKKLWITVSADDLGAFPGQNAITERLETLGVKVARAWWDAKWRANEFRFAADKILAENSAVNYTVFTAGTVFDEGESRAGASGHRNSWRYAYSIEPIREWLFAQRLGR